MGRPAKLPDGLTKRGRTYYASFRKNGRRIRKRLSGDLDTAKELLNELRSRADRADFGLMDNNALLAEIRASYEKAIAQTLRPRTALRYRQNLATILATMPGGKASSLTIERITTYREDRLSGTVKAAISGKKPTNKQAKLPGSRTVNMEVGALSTMLTWAVDHKLIGSNPLAELTPLPTDEKRKERRALSVEEVESIFKHSPAHLKPAFRMLLTAAIRRDELAGMKFGDVDFETGIVTVRGATAKNHKAHEIPLDDEMLATLKTLKDEAKNRQPVAGTTAEATALQAKRLSKDHVFVTKANTPWRNNHLLDRFYRVCRKAGIEGAEPGGSIDLHSLRGTVATLALENGASPKAVQEMLGHSTLAMTMNVYAKATEKAKRAAVGALPYATVTTPAHVLSLSGPNSAPTKSGEAQHAAASTVA